MILRCSFVIHGGRDGGRGGVQRCGHGGSLLDDHCVIVRGSSLFVRGSLLFVVRRYSWSVTVREI